MTSLKKTAEGGYFPKCSNSERRSISHTMEGHRPAFATFIINTGRGLTAFKVFIFLFGPSVQLQPRTSRSLTNETTHFDGLWRDGELKQRWVIHILLFFSFFLSNFRNYAAKIDTLNITVFVMATGSSLSDSVFHRALPTSCAQGSFREVGKEGNMQQGKFSTSCLRWQFILANP